jgi:F-type H+-transporting ATPase subunit a
LRYVRVTISIPDISRDAPTPGEGGHNAVRKFFTTRNIVIILVILAVTLLSAIFLRVPLPTIVLPAEKALKFGNFYITNTFVATIIADITILVLAFLSTRKMAEVPSGLQNLMEWFIETFYNFNEEIAGKAHFKKFFPIFMTLLLFVLVANWWELVPGVDSIGQIEPLEIAYEEAGVTTGWKKQELPGGIYTLVAEPVQLTEEQKAELDLLAAEGAHGEEEVDHHTSAVGGYVLVPYVRAATTDLNVPLALALISVFWTQVVGVQALGLSYFRKFFVPPMTGNFVLDFIVGILELISEFAKIISFTFRLFGNIFAGAVLLFVMTFLIAFIVPLPFYALEVFVGFMQAFVFAILTLIFMSMATISHGHEEEHH